MASSSASHAACVLSQDVEGHPWRDTRKTQLLVSARVSARRCQRPLLQCARSRLCLYRLPQVRCRYQRIPCRLLFQTIRRCRQRSILVASNQASKPSGLTCPHPGTRGVAFMGIFRDHPLTAALILFLPWPLEQPSFTAASAFGPTGASAFCGPALYLPAGLQTQPSLTGASVLGGSTPSLTAGPQMIPSPEASALPLCSASVIRPLHASCSCRINCLWRLCFGSSHLASDTSCQSYRAFAVCIHRFISGFCIAEIPAPLGFHNWHRLLVNLFLLPRVGLVVF